MIPYSVLDLSHVGEGSTAAEALKHSADLARHAERLGYHRFWLAEHHNMTGIASAATAVVIGHVAAATSTIRVGSGGIMLPNHAPLVIAEQFGTLATLFPGRIDLGLGRAPGTDMLTARALRRNLEGGDSFPQDVVELIHYFEDEEPGQRVRAFPGMGTKVPVLILGSSLYGAQLAAHLGLPYAFASHFAPGMLSQAIEVYRETFRPSRLHAEPHFILAMNVFAGETDAEGRFLRSSIAQGFANLRSGRPGPLPRPVENLEDVVDPMFLAGADEALSVAAVGSQETVRRELAGLVARYRPDEVIVASAIHDHAKRLRSLEITADAFRSLGSMREAAE
ncbi:LLM class flavin-dependent oxidoreductase [Aureimonas leprariae]|uniref:Luciferase-like monooxygenase n=1 Tax=Plantimonas leprariae TaxID=2615207 RepID=A0A7V7PR82_9HYPH|nr:LLM class flavin-dependent oxidoreductase [Aureimonas leprariae]KAB0681228.1 LLM class flavin-dependent oxidoreductase [Aureimonas leprariae]